MKDTDVVLYIGPQKIAAMAGELGSSLKITRSVVRYHLEGFQDGLVVNLEKAANSLELVLADLYKDLGSRFEKMKPGLRVHVVLGSDKLKTYTYSSSQYFNGFHKNISSNDVRAVIEQTRSIATLPLTECVLQVIPVSFLVNDLEGVSDPLGMEAQRLGVTLKIFTMAFEGFKNISKALEIADIEVQGFYPKTLTASQAVLAETEKDERTLLVDIDYTATFLTEWKKGELVNTRVLPCGDHYLTEAIARHWKIDQEDAELVKNQYGTLSNDADFSEELIPLIERNGQQDCPVKRGEFEREFQKYAKEWLEKIVAGVKEFSRQENLFYPNYVFTGVSTHRDGFLEFLSHHYEIHARLGRVRNLELSNDFLMNPHLIDALGMFSWLLHEADERQRLVRPKGFVENTVTAARNLFFAYF